MSELKLIQKDIGSGTYGTVSIIEKQGEQYALKVYNRDCGGIYHSLKEIDILFRLKSPRLIEGNQILSKGKYQDIFDDNLTGCIQQLLDGDLYHDFSELPGNKYRLGLQILYEISEGLDHLYQGGYYHLDIKPDNLLYSKKNSKLNFVVADYGMCIPVQKGITMIDEPCQAGTFIFLAPEVIKHNRIEYASCSWPLAITVYQLLFTKGEYFNLADYDKPSNEIVKTVQDTINASHFRFSSKLQHLKKQPLYQESEYYSDVLLLLKNMMKKNVAIRWTPKQVTNYLAEKYTGDFITNQNSELIIKQPTYPKLNNQIKDMSMYFKELIECVKHIMHTEETQIKLKEFTQAWHYFYYLYLKNIINRKADYETIIFKCVELARLFYCDEATLYELRPEKFMIGFLNELDKIIYYNPLACLTASQVYEFFNQDDEVLLRTYPDMKMSHVVLTDEILDISLLRV